MAKDDYCSHCGREHQITGYPKECSCGQTTYRNPLVVAVCVVPMATRQNGRGEIGLVVVERAIPPHVGGLALPGGYQDMGETLEQAAVREFREETGVELDPAAARYFRSRVAGPNTLVFFSFPQLVDAVFTPGPEAKSVTVATTEDHLCFPLHQEVLLDFARV